VPYCLISPPMPGPWGPPQMMYPPCPPWVGWYGLWTLLPMHYHPGWSGPAEGFSHEGYYTGDGCYGSIGHQQGRKSQRQKNQIVQNSKPNHPVSPKTTETLEQPHKQSVQRLLDAQSLGGSQDQDGPKSGTLANDNKAKHSMKKVPVEVAAKQNKAQGKEIGIRAEAVVSSQQQPNWTVQFGKPDHLSSLGSV
jgi:hypothetical protein